MSQSANIEALKPVCKHSNTHHSTVHCVGKVLIVLARYLPQIGFLLEPINIVCYFTCSGTFCPRFALLAWNKKLDLVPIDGNPD